MNKYIQQLLELKCGHECVDELVCRERGSTVVTGKLLQRNSGNPLQSPTSPLAFMTFRAQSRELVNGDFPSALGLIAYIYDRTFLTGKQQAEAANAKTAPAPETKDVKCVCDEICYMILHAHSQSQSSNKPQILSERRELTHLSLEFTKTTGNLKIMVTSII